MELRLTMRPGGWGRCAGSQQWQEGLGDREQPEHIHLEHLAEFGHGHVHQRSGAGDT